MEEVVGLHTSPIHKNIFLYIIRYIRLLRHLTFVYDQSPQDHIKDTFP
jgi:hypothetical protein